MAFPPTFKIRESPTDPFTYMGYRNGMKRLIQHYLEMVIAMFAGMMAWGG